jgi:hypothetical protein
MAVAIPVDPELARLQARRDERREDALVRNPWSQLRLAWTAAIFGLAGEVAWLTAIRARAGTHGVLEGLLAEVGIIPDRLPEWATRIGTEAGSGVALFMLVAGVVLMERAGRRYAPTRHGNRVGWHVTVYRLLALVAIVVGVILRP